MRIGRLIGLFLSIRDSQGTFGGVGQAVIMITATIISSVYQMILRNYFGHALRSLPATINGRADCKQSPAGSVLQEALFLF